MRIDIVKRQDQSRWMPLLSPLIAVALTVVTGGIIFWGIGLEPFNALYVFFVEPLTQAWSLEELAVKAIPIVIIAVGLAICYRANNWNIGAEGQFTIGAITGSALPILVPSFQGPLLLPAMLLAGTAGGMLYAAIPALLKNGFRANEILTSLMLVYVAGYLLDWLVRGPFRNPQGFNFPGSIRFPADGRVPTLLDGSRLHLGLLFALIAVVVAWFIMRRTLGGFQVRVMGEAPRAGSFAGFSRPKVVLATFLVSGGLAGLAGITEVAGPIGKLDVTISPGYGFTAIIVAFLGRLNPIGILIAGFVLALSYLGGEAAQTALGISNKTARVFQGMLLFYVLACDTFILHRLRLVRSAHRVSPVPEPAHGRG